MSGSRGRSWYSPPSIVRADILFRPIARKVDSVARSWVCASDSTDTCTAGHDAGTIGSGATP